MSEPRETQSAEGQPMVPVIDFEVSGRFLPEDIANMPASEIDAFMGGIARVVAATNEASE